MIYLLDGEPVSQYRAFCAFYETAHSVEDFTDGQISQMWDDAAQPEGHAARAKISECGVEIVMCIHSVMTHVVEDRGEYLTGDLNRRVTVSWTKNPEKALHFTPQAAQDIANQYGGIPRFAGELSHSW